MAQSSNSVCHSNPFGSFRALSAYAPAQSYCSSLYPLEATTVTTEYSSTLTVTIDGTVTFTVTDPASTVIETVSPDATQTNFITIIQKKKRGACRHNPSPSPSSSSVITSSSEISSLSPTTSASPSSTPACAPSDSLCSLFSTLTETEVADASTICSCIETRPTSTVTTTPQVTVTPEVTMVYTPSTTNYVTDTDTISLSTTDIAPVTDSVTETEATATDTATSTATASSWCTSGTSIVYATNICTCPYQVECDTTFTTDPGLTLTTSSLEQCADFCDASSSSVAFTYTSSGSCGIYFSKPVRGTSGAAPGVSSGLRVSGFCDNSECQ